jgi:hypothetical protein
VQIYRRLAVLVLGALGQMGAAARVDDGMGGKWKFAAGAFRKGFHPKAAAEKFQSSGVQTGYGKSKVVRLARVIV